MVKYQVTIGPVEWRDLISQELSRNWISQNDMISMSRLRNIVSARHAIFRRLHGELGISAYKIARELGFHHTTVYHALGRLSGKKPESMRDV